MGVGFLHSKIGIILFSILIFDICLLNIKSNVLSPRVEILYLMTFKKNINSSFTPVKMCLRTEIRFGRFNKNKLIFSLFNLVVQFWKKMICITLGKKYSRVNQKKFVEDSP